ncbi:MAG: cbb3-type cytochrome oxidase assembly protein CcoS [Rhodospirillales bacterium]|nr:cbb3-type cytochrome oxidase assembly protein CcoS [Rhodospirillales bacterium]
MTVLIYLIPIALLLGLAALVAFLWALKSGQYEDMDGAANRILFTDETPVEKKSGDEKVGPEHKDS